MNAVGADNDVCLDLAAVGKARHSAAIARLDGGAAGSKARCQPSLRRRAAH
jgi:hypothetical protein